MHKPFAVLLSILAASSFCFASDSEPASGLAETWTESQVVTWAAANSAAANLLQSERAAFSAAIDREDRRQCVQAALVQSVLRDLECHERERSAANALKLFHQLIGLQAQRELLDDAYRSTDKLLRLAEKANELDLADGNRFELDKQRLQIADQQAEAVGGVAKLQVALGELIGKPFVEVSVAQLPLPNDAPVSEGGSQSQDPLQWDKDQALEIALSHRCDLQALQQMCRSLNSDTLPIARQVMSSVQPGLGLAVAIASRKPLLSALHQDDHSAAELCQRREQCAKLLEERRSQIEVQVHVAVIDRDTAINRLAIARQRLSIDEQLFKQSQTAIELDQAKPGSDIIADLERLKSRGKIIEFQTAVSVAIVSLREATGTVLDTEN